jgi:hypothetical protein
MWSFADSRVEGKREKGKGTRKGLKEKREKKKEKR